MKILERVSLAPYTTFNVGGEARYFCIVSNNEDLLSGFEFARSKSLPTFILGGGSNIVASDKGFNGLVIKMEMKGVEFGVGGRVTAKAGEMWDDFVAKTVVKNLWGVENLSLIPGTVGAAPVQNIGAYGVEAKDTIESVHAIHSLTGEVRTFSNKECMFGYRESFFKSKAGKKWVITSVVFILSELPRIHLSYKDLAEFFGSRLIEGSRNLPSQDEIRSAVIQIRMKKFPDLTKIGTAGSFWKNPIISEEMFRKLHKTYPDMPSFPAHAGHVKVSLAWILDKVCGLKGWSEGNVGLFEKQPLVLVAKKGATANEIQVFHKKIEKTVYDKTGIYIEPEVGSLA